jgi:hypothetical protein
MREHWQIGKRSVSPSLFVHWLWFHCMYSATLVLLGVGLRTSVAAQPFWRHAMGVTLTWYDGL